MNPPTPSPEFLDPSEVKIPFFPYRFMGVDAGSNAIKCRIWEIWQDGSIRQLAEQRDPLRLGQGVFQTGLLNENVIQAAIQTFRNIARERLAFKVDRLRAVTTSAMREASNSHVLVQKIAEESGIDLEILPSEEEARLIAKGVLGGQPRLAGQTLMIDIGGGSCEAVLACGLKIVSIASMPLGAVRLREMFFPQSPPTSAQMDLAERHIHDVLAGGLCLPKLDEDLKCLGSSGTIMALQTMTATLPGRAAADQEIGLATLDQIIDQIQNLSTEGIVEVFHLDPARAEIILPGALVQRAIMRHLGIQSIVPARGGVSDGLLQDFLERAGLRRLLFNHAPTPKDP